MASRAAVARAAAIMVSDEVQKSVLREGANAGSGSGGSGGVTYTSLAEPTPSTTTSTRTFVSGPARETYSTTYSLASW